VRRTESDKRRQHSVAKRDPVYEARASASGNGDKARKYDLGREGVDTNAEKISRSLTEAKSCNKRRAKIEMNRASWRLGVRKASTALWEVSLRYRISRKSAAMKPAGVKP